MSIITINCQTLAKGARKNLRQSMFEIDPSASPVTAGTPDKVYDFKIVVKQKYRSLITAITAATGSVQTSNQAEAAHTCTQETVAATNAVITKVAGISETLQNSTGTWTVTFTLNLTLHGSVAVTAYAVTLTLPSPFGVVNNS